ncbi:MAG: hypothetical protein LKJ90_01865 [Faecalibacterium sp.]|jgi:ABC-2 type transport system permease protein|nr:hypothetical protein [Faecalibacterium sp.]
MLKALIATRMHALGAALTPQSSRRRRNLAVTILLLLLIVYSSVTVVFLFYITDQALCAPLYAQGLGWLYWAISALAAGAINCIMTMFLAEHQLFLARDNELLLALPIPPKDILFSRMCPLIATNYAVSLLTLAPAALVYGQQSGFSGAQALGLLLAAVTLPLFCLALSCLAGWGLAMLESRTKQKNKSLIVVLVSVAFLGIYFAIVSTANRLLSYLLVAGAQAAAGVKMWCAPLYWFGLAGEGNLAAALGIAALNLAVFGLVYFCLAKNFIRIATMHRGAAKVQYHEQAAARIPAGKALWKNQLRHFGAAPGWILNGALGSLFAVAAGVMLLVRRDFLMEVFRQMPASLPLSLLLAAVLGFCFAITLISAAAISLEAKTLWILQSCPVTGGQVLYGMAALQLTITLPAAVLAPILGGIGLGLGAGQTVALLLCVAAYAVLTALLGVWCNVKLPKFDWMSETQAVKSSMSTIVSMLLDMGILLLCGGAYALLALLGNVPDVAFLLGCAAAFVLVGAALWHWAAHKGAQEFARL